MAKPDVVVAMPAYNEEAAIANFLEEIAKAFSSRSFHVVVVDDCSTDSTREVLEILASEGFPLTVISNHSNSGHGPSTLKALRLSAALDPEHVISTDGDGHIMGATLHDLYKLCLGSLQPAVIEGVRTHRDDPWFRKTVSSATRALVKRKSGVAPLDANTPFRAYPVRVLLSLLESIPEDHMTPNLLMSTLARERQLPLIETPIVVVHREGTEANGSTWKQRFRALPSRRFLQFCWRAATQWFGTRRKLGT